MRNCCEEVGVGGRGEREAGKGGGGRGGGVVGGRRLDMVTRQFFGPESAGEV